MNFSCHKERSTSFVIAQLVTDPCVTNNIHIHDQASCKIILMFLQFFMGKDENSEDEEKAVVGDVVLPPWATSAYQFIQIHRDVSSYHKS